MNFTSPAITVAFVFAFAAAPPPAVAQGKAEAAASKTLDWQQCSALRGDSVARLQCFDRWAAQQARPNAPGTAVRPSPQASAPVLITMTAPEVHNCKNPRFSELSRYWELEAGSDCGTFGIRGYQPISLSWIGSDSVNTQPTSPSPEHSATSALSFKTSELRIGLSVRTKIAQGLLTQNEPFKRDSIWFAYSQKSNWQLFSGDLSRPFRTTDHEPELIYIYPLEAPLPWGWQLRYAGLSVNHQSNGQPLPLSRSWNRTVLMAGMEKNQEFYVFGKLWYRMPEVAQADDNPDISDLIGRAELTGYWNVNPDHTLGVTLRHSLRANSNGSVRLEWLRKLGDSGFVGNNSGLRLHTQLFSGYGDSLIDYNRRRTVLSVGLSLVDW
ncbi:phospholipase A [Rhodoferax sp.]|uniref:phospholipase A n=1 Tax=Rhodoferax sp. TaxID=50421 RepID=UPI00262D473D|nr:phospholipase A [Rhodoferax sp.]MDD2918995.1 phospholipase A [Rhodoferax sp.]